MEFGVLQVQTADEPARRCDPNFPGPLTADCRDPLARGYPGAPQPELDPQSLSVARAKWNLGEESSVGMIFTNGDPRDEIDNNLIGTDLVYRNSDLVGGQRFVANSWFMRTHSSEFRGPGYPSVPPDETFPDTEFPLQDPSGDDYAFGGRLDFPNDHVSAYVTYAEFQNHFDPRLGYVNRIAIRDSKGFPALINRVGIRDYNSYFRYRTRPVGSWIRTIDHGFQAHFVTNLGAEIGSQDITLNLVEIASNAEDKFRASFLINQENPDRDPYIHPSTYIPAGDYHFNQAQVLLESSGSRAIKGKLEFTSGEYYDGRLNRGIAALELRPDPHLFVSLEWDQANARLPARNGPVCPTRIFDPGAISGCPQVLYPGDFTKRLVRLKLNIAFTTDISWLNTVQYDNVTDTTALNSRLRWEPTPGREFYFVVNQGWISSPDEFVPTTLQLTAKLLWTFRF